MRSNKSRELNTLSTNLASLAKNGDGRYDAPFLYFCLTRLSELYGQSMRFLMCKLINDGLMSNADYAGMLPGLRSEFEASNPE